MADGDPPCRRAAVSSSCITVRWRERTTRQRSSESGRRLGRVEVAVSRASTRRLFLALLVRTFAFFDQYVRGAVAMTTPAARVAAR